MDRVQQNSASEEALNNEGVITDDFDRLSVGGCHLEKEGDDDRAMIVTENPVPGLSREGEVFDARCDGTPSCSLHRQRREKRAHSCDEKGKNGELTSSAKRMALGLSVAEESVNEVRTASGKGTCKGRSKLNSLCSRVVMEAQKSLQKRQPAMRIMNLFDDLDKRLWQCCFCRSRIVFNINEDVTNLSVIYHLINFHGDELNSYGRRAVIDDKISLLERKLKTKLSFLPRTQADINDLPNTEECFRRLSISDERIIKMYREAAERHVYSICFCYQPLFKKPHEHLRDAHRIKIPNDAKRNERILRVVTKMLFNSNFSYRRPVWTCTFCKNPVRLPARRYNTQSIAHLCLIYHLATCHNDTLLATESRIVVDKKIKELEETVKTKLVFLPKRAAATDGLIQIDDYIERFCITDERIIEYYKKAWVPLKNKCSLEAAVDNTKLELVCFCYLPICGRKRLIEHLQSAHGIAVIIADPSYPRDSKLLRDIIFKIQGIQAKKWWCEFCGFPVYDRKNADNNIIYLRAVYHLVTCHNDELFTSGCGAVVREKIKSLEEKLETKLVFLPKTQSDIDEAMNFGDCVKRLMITDEKVFQYYTQNKRTDLLFICFCYFAIYGNGYRRHLQSAHGISLPFRNVESCSVNQNKDREKQKKLRVFLFEKQPLKSWKCVYCGATLVTHQSSEDIVLLRSVFHLVTAHDRELCESGCRAMVDKKIGLLETKLETKLIFSTKMQADINDGTDAEDCLRRLSIFDERLTKYYRKFEASNFWSICFCYRPLYKETACVHMQSSHSIIIKNAIKRKLEHYGRNCNSSWLFRHHVNSSNRFIWKCPFCAVEKRAVAVTEAIQLRAVYHLLNCHENELDTRGLRSATDERIKLLEKELETKLSFIPKTQADVDKVHDTLDRIKFLSVTDEKVIKCYNKPELLKKSFFCVCFCYRAISGTEKSMIRHLIRAHGITFPRFRFFDIIKRRLTDSEWNSFLWKCGFCGDCQAKPRSSQLMAALSLRAHIQYVHIANGDDDNAAKIVQCWNDFVGTLPYAEMLSLCESYLCNGGRFDGNDSRDEDISEFAVECFLCGSSVLGFFSDDISLAVHILKYHSAFEKRAVKFLLERTELEEIFPFLSVTDNAYFSTRNEEKQLRCSKCIFSCHSLKWLCVHASFHVEIGVTDHSNSVKQVSSTLKHFVVADPVLERFLLDSLHRNHNDHHNGHLCRICFRDLLSEEEEIIKHYWMKHPEELGIIAKFLQSEECERKASIER